MVLSFPLIDINLDTVGTLPRGWDGDVRRVASECSVTTRLDGSSSTSREVSGAATFVDVVTGEKIRQELPWLEELYAGPLIELVSEAAGRPYAIDQNLESAINVNTLRGDGARYERHVDSNPLTGLLMVSTLGEDSGGELVFELDGSIFKAASVAGRFLAFDARSIVHEVLPLRGDIERISVPMNFYEEDEDQAKPADLLGYLYES